MTFSPIARRQIVSPMAIALTGATSLAVAMGIGRFAFTPLLPMMLHDGVIDLQGGSLLATANYVGYLVGALLCMLLPALLRRVGIYRLDSAGMVRGGLLATVVLTLMMAAPAPLLWPLLRFVSGVVTAAVFVHTSGWCLGRLAESGHAHLGGVIYAGPGAGIAVSGLAAAAISAANGNATITWSGFAVLALVLTALVWSVLKGGPSRPAAGAKPATAAVSDSWSIEHLMLLAAYGLAGFGYIITATFLPVIARETLANSGWIGLFWPIFGFGVMAGALLTQTIPMSIDRRWLLTASHLIQALSILITLFFPSIVGFVLGSALLGLPFTAITLFGMQETRRLRPVQTTSFMGLMTALYGIGQIAGPPLVAVVMVHSASQAQGFSLSLQVATAALLLGALFYLLMLRFFPLARVSG